MGFHDQDDLDGPDEFSDADFGEFEMDMGADCEECGDSPYGEMGGWNYHGLEGTWLCPGCSAWVAGTN